MSIGNRIKSAREALNMSQTELAEKTGYKSRSSIAKIELGLRDINQNQVYTFAEVLMVSPAYLMGIDNDNNIVNDPKFVLLARNFQQLTEDQKNAILNLVESLNNKEK